MAETCTLDADGNVTGCDILKSTMNQKSFITYGEYEVKRAPEDVAEKELPTGWKDLFVKLCEDLFAIGWDGVLLQTKENSEV